MNVDENFVDYYPINRLYWPMELEVVDAGVTRFSSSTIMILLLLIVYFVNQTIGLKEQILN